MKSLVYRGAEAHIALICDHPHSWGKRGIRRLHAPGSAIVDHYHFELVHGLRFQRPQARLQRLAAGQSRHGYGHDW